MSPARNSVQAISAIEHILLLLACAGIVGICYFLVWLATLAYPGH